MSQTLQSAMARLGLARAAAIALVLTGLVLGLSLCPAAAAKLPIRPASMTSVSVADRCTPSVALTNGTITGTQATTALVTGLGTACGGRVVALTLFGVTGAPLTTATTTLPAGATGTATVIVPAYTPADVAGAAVTIGTWGVPATWTYVPPTVRPLVTCKVINNPAKTCSVVHVKTDQWDGPPPGYYAQFIVESGSMTRDDEWEITINLADPSLRTLARYITVPTEPSKIPNVVLAPGWSCSTMPLLVLRGEVGSQYVGDWLKAWVGLSGSTVAPQDRAPLVACP